MTGKAKVAGSEAAAKRAYWGKRITEWERSGQTQRAFCAQRDLALSTFRWWRIRFEGEAALQAVAQLVARVK